MMRQEEEINRLRNQAASSGQRPAFSSLHQRFQSDLVSACLHELMNDLSAKILFEDSSDDNFDIVKFQDFLGEQSHKQCQHTDYLTMDLELSSIIVLACKRIKDQAYLIEELNGSIEQSAHEYQSVVLQYTEKAGQLEMMQQNLMQLLSLNKSKNP
jgi:hypothetical protein